MTALHRSTDSTVLVGGPPSKLPTVHGLFTLRTYTHDGTAHAVMSIGDPAAVDAPLVRVHSECLTGDALGSHRCDCGDQLSASLAAIAHAGTGILIYLRGHEGRGIGLENKLRAYALQDAGLDTVAANRALDLPDDARDYTAAAAILNDLDCPRITLLSSNPSKVTALEGMGITVADRLSLQVPDRPENAGYLEAKRRLMDHIAPAEHPHVDTTEANTEGTGDTASTVGTISTVGEEDTLAVYDTIAGGDEVVAQLAQSEDGFIATSNGDAQFVSGQIDRAHLHRIRASVGAVLVGCGTVVADDPQLTVRAVPGKNPVRVILDPHGRIPAPATVLTSPEAPTLWLTGAEVVPPKDIGDHVHMVRLPATADSEISPATIISLIREHVSGSILVEGGGRTVSSFLSAGVLDRLFLTSAPVLIGNGVPGIRFEGTEVMAEALRRPFRRYRFGEDMCTEYLLSKSASGGSTENADRSPGDASTA
ncbi:GTP cyclohydrolase II RibA [Brevibacterium aurantiacum]|uniref:GTP cyclohydrolase-2 n=2 Tax=Brevibacterium TaxID=1696 RepID=A0A2A3ZNX2_BREAU|nr:GTP cyclohydrolase II RibA [Brevibacterium aurantiacum]PCC53143.1 GTP cyclohydrolase [Brevibacterium aurantiacum]